MTHEGVSLRKYSKPWLGLVGAVMVIAILAALLLPRSFALTAFSDVIQSLLLFSGAAAFALSALRYRGRVRLFWSLIAFGTTLWFAYQLFWTYNEVLLRRDVPDLCAWDVVLFLHIVPFMAALSLRPHVPRDEYSARVGRLDFALLLVWWFYLYVFLVMPWQYVLPDIPAYNRDLSDAYFAEKLVLLMGLAASWATSKNEWRRIYAALFGMTVCYSAASTFANWAIAAKTYYTGSFYDIPLFAAMAALTWIGLSAKDETPVQVAPEASTVYGVWVARCSMIAVFSLPLFAAWSISDHAIPQKVRIFRLSLTLLAAFCMGVMILVRQQMLDRELYRLLQHSRQSFDNLKRLQTQIVQSEKVASIGQLVGGAAHELNNPITAMLGYSDLLLSTQLSPEQQPLAAKIGHYVRRTKSLVASLISFARPTPSLKNPVDLNTLARTAIQLTQSNWKALNVKVHTQFDTTLPKVLGDSNQLLQVCIQLLANSLHALSERGGKGLTLSTAQKASVCQLQITTETRLAAGDEGDGLSSLDPEDSLGLSACQGILQEHRGVVTRERQEDGVLTFCIELPAAPAAPATEKSSTMRVRWQSQPYA
jgi:signal transduction histidine kinase